MTFFYDLNKRMADLAAKQDGKQLVESAPAPKSPVGLSLEQAMRRDMDKLMESTGDYSAKKAAAGKDIGKPGKNFAKIEKSAGGGEKGAKIAGAVLAKLRGKNESVDEAGLPDVADKAEKMRIAKGGKAGPLKNVARGIKAFVQGKPEPMDEDSFEVQSNQNTTAPDYEKDTELDEAVSRKHFQQIADLLKNVEDPAKRRELAHHHASMFKLANPRFDQARFFQAAGIEDGMEEGNAFTGKLKNTPKGGKFDLDGQEYTDTSDVDEGFADMDAWLAKREADKGTGKFDSRKTSTGTVYTRKPETFASDDEEGGEPAVKRGRGRPTVAKKPERVTAKAYKHKGERKANEGDNCCPHCGHEMVDEKAVSKKQQKFMGMVHAAQKGEKPASKEVGKVAKTMKKSDATDFAATKHKGLPEKVKAKKTEEGKGDGNLANNAKPYDKVTQGDVVAGRLGKDEMGGKKKEKKVEETTVAGAVATGGAVNTAKNTGGMVFGKGVYESFNNRLEAMITESISMESKIAEHALDGDEESITITATGADVHALKDLLRNAGIQLPGLDAGQDSCPSCGQAPCGCDHVDEASYGDTDETMNNPDWPTNKEYSDDALQYAGGLNKPKSTGQTTIPVIANQGRQSTMEESLTRLYKNYKAQ